MSNTVGKINFDNGKKKYVINEDENIIIEFNPSDASIYRRLEEIQRKIKEKMKDMSTGEITADQLDKEVKQMIDYMLNAPVSDKVFNGANCLSPCLNGKQLYMNFLDALAPALRKDIAKAVKKTGKNIESYTSKIVDE